MSKRELNGEELASVLKLHHRVGKYTPKDLPDWPTVADKVKLLEAIDTGHSVVEMDNHKFFGITYIRDGKKVYVRPVGTEFTPCGAFTIEELRKAVKLSNAQS